MYLFPLPSFLRSQKKRCESLELIHPNIKRVGLTLAVVPREHETEQGHGSEEDKERNVDGECNVGGGRVLGTKVTVLLDKVLALADGAVVALKRWEAEEKISKGTVSPSALRTKRTWREDCAVLSQLQSSSRSVVVHWVGQKNLGVAGGRRSEVRRVSQRRNGGSDIVRVGDELGLRSGSCSLKGTGNLVCAHDGDASPELIDIDSVVVVGNERLVLSTDVGLHDGSKETRRRDRGAVHDVVFHDLPDDVLREVRKRKIDQLRDSLSPPEFHRELTCKHQRQ